MAVVSSRRRYTIETWFSKRKVSPCVPYRAYLSGQVDDCGRAWLIILIRFCFWLMIGHERIRKINRATTKKCNSSIVCRIPLFCLGGCPFFNVEFTVWQQAFDFNTWNLSNRKEKTLPFGMKACISNPSWLQKLNAVWIVNSQSEATSQARESTNTPHFAPFVLKERERFDDTNLRIF